MIRKIIPAISLICAIACNQQPEKMKTSIWPEVQPPVAAIIPTDRVIHEDTVTDNYFWMADYFRKGPYSKKVIDYLEAENAYTDTMMSSTRELQDTLYQELKRRIREKDESVPVFYNGYYYYTRTEPGLQYFKYCRRKGSLEAPEELLLDVDEMAKGHAYFAAGGFSVSPDNAILAYGVDNVSRRQYTLHFKNLTTGELLKDAIPNTDGKAVWAADSRTIFYTAKNPATLLSEKIKRHQLQTDPAKDKVVYEEKDKTNYIGVSRSKSGQYIFIRSAGTLSSEIRMIRSDHPLDEFKVFQPRIKDVLYSVVALDDRFIIRTNWNAQNFRLMECPLNATGQENWKELVPGKGDVLLEGVEEFRNFLVLRERSKGLPQLRVLNLSGGEHLIDFGEPAYTVTIGANPEYDRDTLRYIYSSLTTPASTYDYHMSTTAKTLMKRQQVEGGYEPSDYITERLFARAKDGTSIPISLVYKKGLKKDGQAPLLLYGYGSYGINIEPSFSSNYLSLLNRGFIYAIAHIRGGQDMGRQWYEDGKLMKKINTFTDFIDCGQHLIEAGYTSKAHLYAQGGSAGGLLIGAVINLSPEMWHGVIAQVPFVDVVNTMLDESIPLTTNEFDEWGNPKNKDAYFYMKSYSPYENVEKKAYPNILVTTGLHDSQVQYFEPAKWVAKMRAHKTDNNVLLLKTDMKVGHGGASGRFNHLKDVALNYAFLLTMEQSN